jgi:SNF2 family DNA or RNA helicase
MKNAKSKFAQILGQQYQSDHRLLLTGTPLQNNLAELWALLNFLLPKIFHSLDDFEKWFNQPLASVGEKSTSLSEEETLLIINRLHQVLRPFLLRRVKKEVESELPDKVENVLKVELSSWQRSLYDKIHARTYIGSGRIKNLNNSVMQLRKVCNHPYLFYPECRFPINDDLWRCSGKFELLDRLLPKLIKGRHQCLIFFQMTLVMDIMEKYFEYRNFVYLRLDGSTKSEERERRMGLFNAPNSEFPIFLLSTRAGGLGLNLQAADTVILFDSDWNPMMDLQAQDRAHRIGQKREVRVYRLVTNTKIEETILTRASVKKKLDGQVIQAGLFNNNATDKERQDKLRIFLKQDEESEEEEQTVMDDEEFNEMFARDTEEFDLFQSMDQARKQTERFDSRLIRDNKLPDWITEDEKEDQSMPRSYGRGSRVHKKVSYAEEFESCESSESEPNPRKEKRSTKIKISATGVTSSSQSEQPEETVSSEELVIEDSLDSN